MRRTFIDISIHLVTTILLSVLIYLKMGSIFYVFCVILGGIFIDLDHLIDHFMFFKNKFTFRDFFRHTHLKSKKAYVLFHSWELNLILFIAGLLLNSQALIILVLAASMHLAVDNIQRKNKLFYFLLYRLHNKFDATLLVPEHNGEFWQDEGMVNGKN